MRQQEFIAGLGSAAACPVVVRAQQDGRVWRIGVLMGGARHQRCPAARPGQGFVFMLACGESPVSESLSVNLGVSNRHQRMERGISW